MCPDLGVGRNSTIVALSRLHDAFGDGGRRKSMQPVRAPELDPGKTKSAQPANVGPGIMVDLTDVHEGRTVRFEPTTERIRKILTEWRRARAAGILTSAEVSRLLGKVQFLLSAVYGRVGRAASQPLVQRVHWDNTVAFTPTLVAAHDFFEALLAPGTLPALVVPIDGDARSPLLIYTDAAFRWKRKRQRECDPGQKEQGWIPSDALAPMQPWQFHGQLGYVEYDPEDGFFEYGDTEPSPALVRQLLVHERKTYIAQLETLAAVSVYSSLEPSRLAGRAVNHFVDNTVALSSLIHGYSSREDMALITNVFHLQAAALRVSIYLEYVPSKANIADLPSRSEYTLLRSMGAQPGHHASACSGRVERATVRVGARRGSGCEGGGMGCLRGRHRRG